MLDIEKMLKEMLFCLAIENDNTCFDEYRNKYLQDIETLKRALKINFDLSENVSTRDKMVTLINIADNIKIFIEKIDIR